MYKIAVSDHLPELGWEMLEKVSDVSIVGPFQNREQLLEVIPNVDVLIIRSATQVDKELLEAGKNLTVVARAGARIDNIDIDEATRRGIMVINVPDANIFAVVEHTFSMLFAMARKLVQGYNALIDGKWPRHDLLGFQLHGKTIGIVGFGSLGREAAIRARAFGMKVLVYDPRVDLALAREYHVDAVGFPELLRQADILVLMTTLTPETNRLFNQQAFLHMKRGVYLVNCVQGGLIDENALLDAIDNGIVAGAAIDTFEKEPVDPGYPLVNHERVLTTPHLNQNTVESQNSTAEKVVKDVLDAIRKEDYRNVINLPFTEVTYKVVKPYINLALKLGKLQGQIAEGWITRVEIEVIGEGLEKLIRPIAAVLLSGMIRPDKCQQVNWVSAPMLAFEQGIITAQVKNLLHLRDYPNLLICKVYWEGGSRTVAGVLFANGEARLVHYDGFTVDAIPDGYVLILENQDVPGVIGKVGTMLGASNINIANWRYGREIRGGKALSFISLDNYVSKKILKQIEDTKEIHRARLVKL